MPNYAGVGGYVILLQSGRVCLTIEGGRVCHSMVQWEGMLNYGKIGGYAKL